MYIYIIVTGPALGAVTSPPTPLLLYRIVSYRQGLNKSRRPSPAWKPSAIWGGCARSTPRCFAVAASRVLLVGMRIGFGNQLRNRSRNRSRHRNRNQDYPRSACFARLLFGFLGTYIFDLQQLVLIICIIGTQLSLFFVFFSVWPGGVPARIYGFFAHLFSRRTLVSVCLSCRVWCPTASPIRGVRWL